VNPNRAEPFVLAATVGLCARNVAHDPAKLAAAAVDLGLAVAVRFEELTRGGAVTVDRAAPALTEADARRLFDSMLREHLGDPAKGQEG